MKKKNSLNVVIWKYFLLFSLLILGFLWTFQVLFLNKYYRYIKIKDVKTVAKAIKYHQQEKSLEETINKLAYDKSVCVEVIDQSFNSLYSSSFLGKGCFSGKEQQTQYKYKFIINNEQETSYELINPKFNNQTYIYALRLNNNQYVFINTSLEPIDSTVHILREQLFLITIIVLILSFLLSYFISKHISNPIIKLNQTAKKLATGNFNLVFDNNTQIEEIQELSNTLNYVNKELSKTDQYRRDLMANVSHDLKTPLTMIKAYAEMSRDLHVNQKKKRQENLNIIIEETDRLTTLVNDILDLSKMQSDMEKLKIEQVELISMIEKILKRYQILKETEKYNFIFEHSKEKLYAQLDRKKIEQVIYNLINNAIYYTGTDHQVKIKVKENKEGILIEIIDTGKGIAKKDIPYIWDKYYKTEKLHKRNLIGTGLGLSIVKNILELHQFPYGIESKNKKGSNFYFLIPNQKIKQK